MDPSSDNKRKLEDGESSRVAKRNNEGEGFATSSDALALLLRSRASDLWTDACVVFTAQKTDKVVAVWKGMQKQNVTAVPVLNKTNQKYYGVVEIKDIVFYIVKSFGKEELSSVENFWDLVDKSDKFQDVTVRDVMKAPLTKKNPFHPVGKEYSLLFVFELLARERDLHRVPVVARDFTLINIITQSMAIGFLTKNSDKLGSIINKPVSLFSHISKDVVTVKVEDEALHAFQKMIDQNVSGVAIVDGNDKLIGNLSLRDLKKISEDGRLFWRLYQTVGQFMENDDGALAPRFVGPNETLMSVLAVLNENKIHRVYICNETQQPTGVVSLQDVLSEVLAN